MIGDQNAKSTDCAGFIAIFAQTIAIERRPECDVCGVPFHPGRSRSLCRGTSGFGGTRSQTPSRAIGSRHRGMLSRVRSVALTLAVVLAAPSAAAIDCERLSPHGSSPGCLLDLGRFPYVFIGLSPPLERGAPLASVLAKLGEPDSKRVTPGEDRERNGPDHEDVELSYPGFTLQLHCGAGSCWLRRFELERPEPDLACGFHVGMRVEDLLAHPDVQPAVDPPETAHERRSTLAWERNYADRGICYVSWATIAVEAADDGRIERIVWTYHGC